MPYDLSGSAEIIRLASRSVPESVEDRLRELLLSRPRKLHMTLSYDEVGSSLYAKLCRQPEYYLARTEKSLLYRESGAIIAIGQPSQLVDLGCGNFEKTQILLHEAVKRHRAIEFTPCDIDETVIAGSLPHLSHFYTGGLAVRALVGSYETCLGYLRDTPGRRLFSFTGNTYSNLSLAERESLLQALAQCMTNTDHFLLGVDLIKPREVLERAYNDAAGCVRDAMLQMLTVLNRDYEADFDVEAFDHISRFDPGRRAVISFLVSRCDQRVRIDDLDLSLDLQTGECVEAEAREKFVLHELLAELAVHHFSPVRVMVDEANPYALLLLRKDAALRNLEQRQAA